MIEAPSGDQIRCRFVGRIRGKACGNPARQIENPDIPSGARIKLADRCTRVVRRQFNIAVVRALTDRAKGFARSIEPGQLGRKAVRAQPSPIDHGLVRH